MFMYWNEIPPTHRLTYYYYKENSFSFLLIETLFNYHNWSDKFNALLFKYPLDICNMVISNFNISRILCTGTPDDINNIWIDCNFFTSNIHRNINCAFNMNYLKWYTNTMLEIDNSELLYYPIFANYGHDHDYEFLCNFYHNMFKRLSEIYHENMSLFFKLSSLYLCDKYEYEQFYYYLDKPRSRIKIIYNFINHKFTLNPPKNILISDIPISDLFEKIIIQIQNDIYNPKYKIIFDDFFDWSVHNQKYIHNCDKNISYITSKPISSSSTEPLFDNITPSNLPQYINMYKSGNYAQFQKKVQDMANKIYGISSYSVKNYLLCRHYLIEMYYKFFNSLDHKHKDPNGYYEFLSLSYSEYTSFHETLEYAPYEELYKDYEIEYIFDFPIKYNFKKASRCVVIDIWTKDILNNGSYIPQDSDYHTFEKSDRDLLTPFLLNQLNEVKSESLITLLAYAVFAFLKPLIYTDTFPMVLSVEPTSNADEIMLLENMTDDFILSRNQKALTVKLTIDSVYDFFTKNSINYHTPILVRRPDTDDENEADESGIKRKIASLIKKNTSFIFYGLKKTYNYMIPVVIDSDTIENLPDHFKEFIEQLYRLILHNIETWCQSQRNSHVCDEKFRNIYKDIVSDMRSNDIVTEKTYQYSYLLAALKIVIITSQNQNQDLSSVMENIYDYIFEVYKTRCSVKLIEENALIDQDAVSKVLDLLKTSEQDGKIAALRPDIWDGTYIGYLENEDDTEYLYYNYDVFMAWLNEQCPPNKDTFLKDHMWPKYMKSRDKKFKAYHSVRINKKPLKFIKFIYSELKQL